MAAKFGTLSGMCTFCSRILLKSAPKSSTNIILCRYSSHSYGSLISTSLPDIDTEIENLSLHSARGKAMKRLQDRLNRRVKPMPIPRETRMEEDQDWTAVYPTAATFKWSAVPLPLRMGYPAKRGLPPHKYGNLELMKIPNFLHLTPPAIKKHCAALKEFCTEWPAGLETDEKCEQHFPLEVESSDYVFSSPSVRHPMARVITIKIKLGSLELDEHARWKLIQLVGDRYNKDTDIITITTDRCPVKKQNYDYALYLLTVLYHESWATEPWEAGITEEDREKFIWDINQSKKNLLKTVASIEQKEITEEKESEILNRPEIQEFKAAVTNLRNEVETNESLDRYKQAVLNIVHKTVQAVPS